MSLLIIRLCSTLILHHYENCSEIGPITNHSLLAIVERVVTIELSAQKHFFSKVII